MTLTYLDASAAMKLVVEEPESDALAEALASGRRLVASWLLHTELQCAAGRHPDDVSPGAVHLVLNTVSLADLTRGDLIAAGTHLPLRSNDAIHLATAIRLGVGEMATYDAELAAAAASAGLSVLAPSAPISGGD
ncbi:MAG: PIN domain-containing protein [Thermoleophilia bacterium]